MLLDWVSLLHDGVVHIAEAGARLYFRSIRCGGDNLPIKTTYYAVVIVIPRLLIVLGLFTYMFIRLWAVHVWINP